MRYLNSIYSFKSGTVYSRNSLYPELSMDVTLYGCNYSYSAQYLFRKQSEEGLL